MAKDNVDAVANAVDGAVHGDGMASPGRGASDGRPEPVLEDLQSRFGPAVVATQTTRDGIPTAWIAPDQIERVLRYLKTEAPQPYRMLYDLSAIDERSRRHREGQPASDFTVVYHLLSLERNADIRLKVALRGGSPSIRTVTGLWPSANWYERELWDMFGVMVQGHPNLRRILLPPGWEGHALRKEHPARATEMAPFRLSTEKLEQEQDLLRFRPEEWGLRRHSEDTDFLFLNLGPQHPGTHGVFRIVLQLDGEEILDAVPQIGFHHRAAEKMGERQTWHTYIPYTDRVEYLSGCLNELAYVLAVERLAGIEVPERTKVIRVMMAELYRIASHLVWYGTFAQDVGALTPVFLMFTDREFIMDIVEGISGGRMHPGYFRIGGLAMDLPEGWDRKLQEFIDYLPPRMAQYDKLVMQNSIFRGRTVGIGGLSTEQAIEWGVTGPNLRATGLAWDYRKARPYSGYEQFEFEIPVGHTGDCYDRAVVHVAEIYQSLRILQQCVDHMPAGPFKAEHPLTTPPPKERTLHDIETLINHFLNVSWGPVMPAGEAHVAIESSKGVNGYYLVSDEDVHSYRTRIRAPSFAHLQLLPLLSRGYMVPDLLAILGSIDFVMSDVDR